MQWNDHAAGEPDAHVSGEVEGLVGDADVDRLVGREPGLLQRVADRARRSEKLAEANSLERLARRELQRGFGEEGAEVQIRETEKAGGWRSDCATTQ